MQRRLSHRLSRRRFLLNSALTGSGIVAANLLAKPLSAQNSGPAIIRSKRARPTIPYGVASGDISGNRAIVGAVLTGQLA
ncbi:hypothetical protein [Leptolyngbya sp. FACHB-261]|uniref:hypothetical protein n=1 Tax=Leptolyngbya sp. FACHB-261 TaxID=2692806 RepID=UPI0018EFD26F|nr:hypothetical protein [Leptolyngbya sp. FACHB-261]